MLKLSFLGSAKKSVCGISLLVLLLVFSFSLQAQEADEDYEPELLGEVETAFELDPFPGDLISEIIDFVRERDPVLSSQREVIELIDERDNGTERPEGEVEELPEYIRSSLREEELAGLLQKQEAQEKYTALNRELVSELLAKLSEIFSFNNEIKNQNELYDLLLAREETTQRQVEAGILEPQALQDLSEEIINVRTAISDAELNRRMLKMELALNYGGQDWQELRELIDRLESQLYE